MRTSSRSAATAGGKRGEARPGRGTGYGGSAVGCGQGLRERDQWHDEQSSGQDNGTASYGTESTGGRGGFGGEAHCEPVEVLSGLGEGSTTLESKMNADGGPTKGMDDSGGLAIPRLELLLGDNVDDAGDALDTSERRGVDEGRADAGGHGGDGSVELGIGQARARGEREMARFSLGVSRCGLIHPGSRGMADSATSTTWTAYEHCQRHGLPALFKW
nr:uncharacterized PE-PGRS family protein PE_PGRS44-like [Aegilops tauschii subsp. strangulata]